MKKISLLFTAALLFVAASCVNQEIISDEAQPLKLNLTVAAPGGPDTKAAKTAWVAGDKINFWFDDNAVNHTEPDFVITYKGGIWLASPLREGITLKDNGYFSVVYESTNNLSSYKTDYSSGVNYYYPPEATYSDTSLEYGQDAVPVYCRPLIVTANNIRYTFASNTLTAKIEEWRVESTFKVLVKNVPSELEASDYILKTYNTSQSWPAEARSGFSLKINNSSVPVADGNINANRFGLTGGVQESDGIAFYYNYFSNHWPPTDPASVVTVTFTLYEGNTSTKSYYVNKSFENTGYDKCFGVSIDYSKFN